MKILVCVWDFPYPPRGGGRGDVWRRIEAFRHLGHEVMMVNLYDPDGPRVPSADDLAHVDSLLTDRYSFPIQRGRMTTVRQLAQLPRLPWHVATRIPGPAARSEIDRRVRAFGPDVVWLDGPWFGELGRELASVTGASLAYRSHNVEHLYLRRQAAAAKRRRDQIRWRVATVGLKRYQLGLMRAADAVFDISLDDLAYWRGQGITDAHWLPPLPELALVDPPAETVPSDVLFVGGLRTPNNQQGVRWLVTQVLPLVTAQRPDVSVSIVGSYPHPELVEELRRHPRVTTHYDVPDVKPHQFGARVLVNPVGVGSGVQVKMLDMLMTDAPIVTRSQGTSGLPRAWASQFDVADTPQSFAAAIVRNLDAPSVDLSHRAEVRRVFGVDAVKQALALF